MDRSEKCDKNCRIWFDSTKEIAHQVRWSRKLRLFYHHISSRYRGSNHIFVDLIKDGPPLYVVAWQS
jgi:hypothetical protein